MPQYIIQRFITPSRCLNLPDDLYFRNSALCSSSQNKYSLRAGGKVCFNTFFNSLSIARIKKICNNLDSLSLRILGKGKVQIDLFNDLTDSRIFLSSAVLDLSPEVSTKIEIPSWKNLSSGLLSISLHALSECENLEIAFITDIGPFNQVKLAIVITHFNRKPMVLPAIGRIEDELTETTNYCHQTRLIVVDNSSNIYPTEVKARTVLLPSKNFGGSGGFTKGLLYAKAHGFTHCIFMDDDASCEVESIRRAVFLLERTSIPNMGLAGSLMDEDAPTRLYEKGAVFNGLCRPLHHNLNMSSPTDLVLADKTNTQIPNYGGWWFFCFKIDDVRSLPFPFFVRGDDILFSLMHSFRIETINGIACWGEKFSTKHSPLTAYLDARYHLFININFLDFNRLNAISIVMKSCLLCLFSYKYASAKAVVLALKHFNLGPSFWQDHLDLTSIRNEIANFTPGEIMAPLAHQEQDHQIKQNEHFGRLLLRILSLQGIFIPRFLFKSSLISQHKNFHANLSQSFLRERILYKHQNGSTGFVAEIDKKLFWRIVLELLLEMGTLFRNFTKIKMDYKKEIPYLTSTSFWNKVHSEDFKDQ